MNKKVFSRFFIAIGSFLALFIGRLSWSCPPWLDYIRKKAISRPYFFWGTSVGFIISIFLISYGYQWYTHLPHPKKITANITVPQITPISKILVPDTLTINFGLNQNGFNPKSVAPLRKIGKEVTKDITLIPETKGKWVWQSDNQLVFSPNQDWLAGQKYTVQFNKNTFAKNIKMEKLAYTFVTQPFQTTVTDFKFYQDPINPQLKQVIATIHFNYPVDSSSLESKTTLLLQALKNDKLDLNAQHYKYTMTYDEHKRTAYLRSESIQLPDVARYLLLNINKGVKSYSSSDATATAVTQSVLIPDVGSYFKINQAATSIVRNEKDKPEQILTIETTLGVKEPNINQSLHAYLLPQDYPATATEEAKTNYQWQNPGEVTPDILQLSTPLDLQAIPADRDYATLHSYKFSAQNPRFIYLKIDKGLKGFGDFALTTDYGAVLGVPEYPKEISFLHQGSLLALSGEKKFSVIVRGVPAVKFQLARVLPQNINQLITQTKGKFSHPRFINSSFNQQNISEIFSEIQQFDITDLSKGQYTALDIGKYLSSKANTVGPQGLFLLHATGWDTEKNTPLDIKADRLILITDLGLLIKDNSDGSHDVFVQSITKGAPLDKVQVAILGKNGLPILTRTTDAEGRATFPLLDDFTDEREPTVYLAKMGNDVAFIPYNKRDQQLNYSRFDIGGIVSNQELRSLSAYLFSDRGIYRPGDTAHIGVIIKQAYAVAEAAGLPLQIIITDPRGVTIKDEKFTLDATGYSTFNFQTDPTSLSGQYVINIFIIQDNHPGNLLGSATVRVAEFQPDRMRITSHLSQEQPKGWISPNDLTANVGLWNLYGAPAVNRKVSAKILLAPQQVRFSEFPNYTFFDPLFDPTKPPKVFSEALTNAHTNDQGQAHFDLNLNRFDKATYQLTLFTEGFEADSGRSVTTQTTALVSPLSFLIGYKSDGDLNYIKQDTQRNVNFIAINSQLKQLPINNLKIQLTALNPVTTLVKNPNGTYQYQSLIQTTVISTTPFALNENGINFSLPTQQIGNFVVTLLDQNNTELSRLKYSVVGASQSPLAKNTELDIKLNKSEYMPDEEIELQITAPYTGAGLITIERDKVYASQWFKTNATHSLQKIKVPKELQGNGYINVAFVRDWNSPDIFISPLSYNIAPFNINHENHAIHIDLTTPTLAQPGKPFVIDYKSNKPGKIIIFAVDEGILQVTNYKTPDPLGFFFQKHALEVITQQTLDQILPKFIHERELSSIGGDGGNEELLNNLNPFKRKTDLPVVFWSGIVDTDNTSRQLTYNVPDYFNGTLRVMAVAVAEDSVGAASKLSEVRGNFVINPNVPTFVAPGDEFEITASIANNVTHSGQNAKIEIQLETTPQLEIVGNSQQIIPINEGHEQTVHFKLRAKSLLGAAQLTFIAKNADKSSRIAATLSVRPASAYITTIKSGSSQDAKKSVIVDRDMYPEFRKVEAAISSSPLILISGLQQYLDNFPYGCTEQLVSKAFPLLAMINQPWFSTNTHTITDKIDMTIRMLHQRQMASGGFSYWPTMGENINNTFASVYAMHFLTEAKLHGYVIPNELVRSGINFLKELASENVSDLEQARIQAYAIYILTRNEIVTTNYLTNLQIYLEKNQTHTWQKDIISAYIAATYQLLKSYSDADRLINYYKPQIGTETESTDFYNSNISDAQYLYLLAKHFPDYLAQANKKLVMPLVTVMNKDDINTLFAAYASLAFNAYTQSYQATNSSSFSISETLSDGKQPLLAAPNSIYEKVSLAPLAKRVNFSNPNKQNYFYQLIQSGFNKTTTTASLSQGLEVYREYRDLKNNILTQASLGNEVEVHIKIRALGDSYLNNLVIVDLLPGGFEVVRDSVNSNQMDYVDLREDRVIFFGGVGSDAKELVYRIKATNIGQYIAPPIFAGSMYDLKIKAYGTSGKMLVK